MPKINKYSYGNINTILLFILVIIAAGGVFVYYKKNSANFIKPKEVIEDLKLEEPEKEEAVPEPKPESEPESEPEPQPLPPPPQQSDKDLIREAFAKKYNKSVDDVSVSISKSTNTLASGGVSFSGEMGGGWFYAAKVNDKWIIVDDGNGTISCQKTDPYNFPVSMLPECYDEVKQDIVIR